MKKKILFGIIGMSFALVLGGFFNEPSKAEKAKTRWDPELQDCKGSQTACADEIIIWG